MPRLPSGLTLALARDAIIEHSENWFSCPEGHFWFWTAAPEMGPPPYDPHAEIMTMPEHAPAPTSREEMGRFIRVMEMRSDGIYAWRGEWLADFPKYRTLDTADANAWKAWLDRPQNQVFLDEAIERCRHMSESARTATGYVVGTVDETTPDQDRGVLMRIWNSVPWLKRRRPRTGASHLH